MTFNKKIWQYKDDITEDELNRMEQGIADAHSHIADTTVHITAAERTTWNNKAEKSVATQTSDGLMSKTDKTKLDGIAAGAEVNQNAFSNVKVGSTTVAADSKTDTLELVAGSNITITPDATNDKVTIAANVPVSSVNGKTGVVSLTASDVGAETPDGAQAKANTAETNAKNYAVGLNTVALIDKRDTNELPSYYLTSSNGRKVHFEFKQRAVIGIPSTSGTYCLLITIAQWIDTSGGTVKQLAYDESGRVFIRTSNGTSAWNSWAEMETTAGSQSKADQAEASAKSYADGKFLPSASYTANDVLNKLKTVDGSGSGLDADLLDGKESSAFAQNFSLPPVSSSPSFVKIAELDTNIGSGENGLILYVNGIANFGGNMPGVDIVQVSTRGSVGLKAYRLIPGSTSSVTYGYVNNATTGKTEIWLKRDAYNYGLNIIVANARYASYGNLLTQSTEPSGITYITKETLALTTDNVASASKLQTARTISLSGDASGSASFDGSANASIGVTLANTGVTAGTYPKVTVDAKGRVTGGQSLSASDIPNLDWSKITSGKPTTLSGYGITDAVNKNGDSTITGRIAATNFTNKDGYKTSNTGTTDSGKWTKIATLSVAAQYAYAIVDFDILGGHDGTGNAKYASVYARLKQQNSLGSQPYVNILVKESVGISAADIVGVVTKTDTSGTSLDIYIKIPYSYEEYRIFPISFMTTVSYTITFYETQGFVASLPTGTQTVAQNIGSSGSYISITDSGGYYTSGNVEGALQEIGQVLNAMRGSLIDSVNSILDM